jgi:tRNA A37 threonylcarbamoyladenosine modification protein TsaB
MLTKEADCLTKPEKCLSTLSFGAGSAFELYNLPSHPVKIDKTLLPSADSLIKIALESIKKKRMIPPHELQLNYLRNEVVHKS